jgi:CheY-like chemotaxis protein
MLLGRSRIVAQNVEGCKAAGRAGGRENGAAGAVVERPGRFVYTRSVLVKPKKILVVDDSDLMRRMYGVMLRGAGLLSACDGEEALEIIAAEPEIDLVLLDINMPKMNGFEVLRELGARGLFPALRVIVVTTEGREEDATRGLAAGAATYLTKPFRAEEVRAAIAALPDSA